MLLEKYSYLIKLFISTAAVYFAMKYLLPLFLPFVLAYGISRCIRPLCIWINNKIKIPEGISIFAVLMIFIGIITSFVILIGYRIAVQGVEFVNSLPDGIGRSARDFLNENKGKLMSYAMDSTVKTVMVAFRIIIFIVTMLISAFYITRDYEKILRYGRNMKYSAEIGRITGRLHMVFSAYIKAQLVIMSVTAAICTTGLYVIGTSYALLLGVMVSFLDALPMIGATVILLPWAVYYFVMGKNINGIIMLIVCLLCYVTREIIEPRIMGNEIGLPPIVSVISIFVGYSLFGIVGVVIGPVSYIIIEQLMKQGSG